MTDTPSRKPAYAAAELGNCPSLRSSVNYLGPMNERPVFYAQHVERDNLVLEPHEVDIYDARALDRSPGLETAGFTLARHRTRVRNFSDPGQVASIYRPEIEALLLEMTGAERVLVGNAVLRWSERAGDMSRYVNSRPARFVHVDYSRESFESFARFYVEGRDDAADLLRRRFVAYNVWRATNPPPHDVPFALCDANTAHPDDVVTGEAVIDAPGKPEVRFGSSLYRAHPDHRWFWYSDMQLDEAMVFKAFDRDQARVQGCPHSAFDNPGCPADTPPRGSVEIRAYAFFAA